MECPHNIHGGSMESALIFIDFPLGAQKYERIRKQGFRVFRLFTPLNRCFRLSRVFQTIDLEKTYRLVLKMFNFMPWGSVLSRFTVLYVRLIDFRQIFDMDVHGFPWISMNFLWTIHGLSMPFPWISMDFPWTFHVHPWTSMSKIYRKSANHPYKTPKRLNTEPQGMKLSIFDTNRQIVSRSIVWNVRESLKHLCEVVESQKT